MGTREASHAGSWYEDDPDQLSSQLDEFLGRVPETLDGSNLPIPKARVIIAPHAGYSYSGPCAAWAYKALDLRSAKRVFILGPSHTYYLRGCALTTFDKYGTPFGDLTVDKATTSALKQTGQFSNMTRTGDVAEHSLEMHLPYLWKRLEQTFGEDSANFPPIVPILVGDASCEQEKAFGALFAPFIKNPENAFIVSSDFCHWGSRFDYRPHYADGLVRNMDGRRGELELKSERLEEMAGSQTLPIHEVIRVLDEMAMDAVKTGVHTDFYKTVQKTQNTVCGRHPIGVVVAALELLMKEGLEGGKGLFKFVQYQRSSLVKSKQDSSVSYVSAYAVV
ncbi:MEMO1 family [Schizothecium vesticola]|uniref:MEMO1 family n=1 Tax=Schizothecium vesticola TaxID=314040 RepID=A0AA40F377_9PEZI|nr:MEMO1 family [Schizothecium vesticola]